MLRIARSYRFVASLVSLTLVLGVAAPFVECCIAGAIGTEYGHGGHEIPISSATDVPADCHGGDEASAPADEDCCLFAATSGRQHSPEAIVTVTKLVVDEALVPTLIGEVPSPTQAGNSRAPTAVPEPTPRTHIYLIVSSLLI